MSTANEGFHLFRPSHVHVGDVLGTTLCPKQAHRISIFFFDIPFLLIRGMLFYVSIQVAEPELSVLVMKNSMCLLMNFLQFKVLNQASEEAEGDIHKLIGGRNSSGGASPKRCRTGA